MLTREQVRLRLKRMESALVRSHIKQPDVIAQADYELLRYALVLARMQSFVIGAATTDKPWACSGATVTIADELLASLSQHLLERFYSPLREQRSVLLRLTQVREGLSGLRAMVAATRERVLAAHSHELPASALDAEICHKVLVLTPGGGGGSGFVYIGLVARLIQEGLLPSYVVGASIGALLGGLMARDRVPDIDGLLGWGKGLKVRQLFSQPRATGGLSLPGVVRLHLQGMDQMLRHADGSPLRIQDLAIPYDAMIAGVRLSAYRHLPDVPEKRSHILGAPMLIAERMLQLIKYFSPHVAKEIVLGRDAHTSEMRVVDAIGLSSAIPGVLQYAPWHDDPHTHRILSDLREIHQVRAFMDGGTVANVPARAAWQGVQDGRIGTRNAYYLALDCFHPQWSAGHAWLIPVTQAIQAQLPEQRPFYDWMVRFQPTPSPVNLLPSETMFDKAVRWGWDQADEVIPQLREAMRPIAVPDWAVTEN